MKFLKENFKVVILVVGFLLAIFLILSKDIYIKNLGTSIEQNGAILNSISVSSTGEVYVKPDLFTFNFSFSEVNKTSEEALSNVNIKSNKAIEVLKEMGIDSNDIKTLNLSINPEYDYSLNKATLTGQRATISVFVKVKNILDNTAKASKILDSLSEIEDIQILNIAFDLDNKESALSEARKIAMDKAKNKANELANFSGVKLIKPVSILENNSSSVINPIPYSAKEVSLRADSANATSLFTGELKIAIDLQVIFGID